MMPFYEHLREYREQQLNISQKEVASRLNIDHSSLSKYERGERAIPIDLLPDFKRVLNISDKDFLNMVLNKPYKSENPGPQAQEVQKQYIYGFYDELLIGRGKYSSDFREIVIFLSKLNDQDLKNIKNWIKP